MLLLPTTIGVLKMVPNFKGSLQRRKCKAKKNSVKIHQKNKISKNHKKKLRSSLHRHKRFSQMWLSNTVPVFCIVSVLVGGRGGLEDEAVEEGAK